MDQNVEYMRAHLAHIESAIQKLNDDPNQLFVVAGIARKLVDYAEDVAQIPNMDPRSLRLREIANQAMFDTLDRMESRARARARAVPPDAPDAEIQASPSNDDVPKPPLACSEAPSDPLQGE